MLTNTDKKMPENAEFICDECGKIYKHRQSLHVHKRKCLVKVLLLLERMMILPVTQLLNIC